MIGERGKTQQMGFINKEGSYVINPQFWFAEPFIGKFAKVRSDNKLGFINTEGKYVINPQFEIDRKSNISNEESYTFALSKGEYSTENLSVVTTDFFDINKIVSLINLDKFNGVSFNESKDEVESKAQSDKMMNDNVSYYKYLIAGFLDNNEVGKLMIEYTLNPQIKINTSDNNFNNFYATNINFNYPEFAYIFATNDSLRTNAISSAVEKSLKVYKKLKVNETTIRVFLNADKIIISSSFKMESADFKNYYKIMIYKRI